MGEIGEESAERFRKLMKEECGVDLDAASAKTRYLPLLTLFWILAHRIPEEGDPPYEPPLPPWL
jgi:hypothetical protein